MSALYAMRYVGQTGVGAGALYVGKGKIVGIDIGNGRYAGSYTVDGGRLKGNVIMSFPEGGLLVTGQNMPNGASLQLTADWPEHFSGGAQTIMVGGKSVSVTLEKIGDIP